MNLVIASLVEFLCLMKALAANFECIFYVLHRIIDIDNKIIWNALEYKSSSLGDCTFLLLHSLSYSFKNLYRNSVNCEAGLKDTYLMTAASV